METSMGKSGRLGIGEFLTDIRYVITSPVQRFPVIRERGALWGSILLLVAPAYFAFTFAGGVYFDREPFPGYSFLLPAVLAVIAQLLKAYFIHFFGRMLEGKGRYFAATGRYRDMLTVFGYATVPGMLAAVLATALFILVPGQVGAALRDFRAVTLSVFIAVGIGLWLWNLILLVLAFRLIYPMRDYKIVIAIILGSILVIIPAAATGTIVVPVHVPYTYLQPIVSARVLGFLAINPEESRGKDAKISIHVDRMVYKIKPPRYFDLVAYDPSTPAGSEQKGGLAVGKSSLFSWHEWNQLIGRIVGLPGDSVELVQGQLRINGQAWAEPYIQPEYQTKSSLPPVHLGTDQYLVLPENRHLLEPSEADVVMSRSRITGRALVVKWPIGWALFSPSAFLHAYPLNSGQ